MTKKKELLHEYAGFALYHGLKRLKYKHKEVSQVNNFIKYIETYKKHDEFIASHYSAFNYNEMRDNYDEFVNFIYIGNHYDYPNLYHYALEDLKTNMERTKGLMYNHLPVYSFNVAGSNKTVNDADGVRNFSTVNDMWRYFKSHHDIDSTAFIVFEDKKYYPCRREDCINIFNVIGEIENTKYDFEGSRKERSNKSTRFK